LRALAPEERRAVLEYFRRLNASEGQTADGGRRTADPPKKP
jgi:hypothetical protein